MDVSIRATPDGKEDGEEAIDPRIEIELNKLNSASHDINILEKQLDEARAIFRQRLTDAARNLKAIGKSLGQTVDKARPYFEAMNQAKKAQQECHQAAVTFERACQLHKSAREAIAAAEEKLMKNPTLFDSAWQEVLNNADMKLMEAEREKYHNERLHEEAALAYQQLAERASQLEKQLKKSVNKARPYFEQKAQFLGYLEDQKARVQALEKRYNQAKLQYATSLKALETISEEIHRRRLSTKPTALLSSPTSEREDCVGAESSTPAPTVRRKISTQRSDSKIREVVSLGARSFLSGRFRSSLQFDLDLDLDIEGLDALSPSVPKSPSSISVDIGCVNRSVHSEYEVLDVAPLLEMERRLRLSVGNDKIEEISESTESLNKGGAAGEAREKSSSSNRPENGLKSVLRTLSDSSSVFRKLLPLPRPSSTSSAVEGEEGNSVSSGSEVKGASPITVLDMESAFPMPLGDMKSIPPLTVGTSLVPSSANVLESLSTSPMTVIETPTGLDAPLFFQGVPVDLNRAQPRSSEPSSLGPTAEHQQGKSSLFLPDNMEASKSSSGDI